MAPRDRIPPTPEQADLLRSVAARTLAGPMHQTLDRDRLRRLGFIEAYRPEWFSGTSSQALYRVTDAGHAWLSEHKVNA